MSSIDRLLWNIAADSMTAVTKQTHMLVRAARDDAELLDVVRARIDNLRSIGQLAMRKADEFERELRGETEPTTSAIADEFSSHMENLQSELDN